MEQTRKRNHVILVLAAVFFALLLWCAGGQEVKAETLKTQTVELDGILQNGDLLVEQEAPQNSKSRKAPARNANSFDETVKAGLDNYQAANSENKVTIDVSGCNVTVTEIKQKFTDFINANPRYFYIKKTFSYGYDNNDMVVRLTLTLTDTPANISKMLAAYDAEVNAVVSSMDKSWSDLEKALYANDYLAINCEYDNTYSNYSAYDVFVNKTAVCQGYALAFQELMDRAETSCEVVTSDKLNHAWNLVSVNGSWYHVDTTWNDPTKDRIGRARHFYLLKSTNWFQSETGKHTAADYMYTGGKNDSTASSTAYDNYFWNSIDNPFGYSNGHWYGNDNGTIKQYKGSASDLTSIKDLKTISEKWNVWDKTTSYWQGNFSGFSLYDDNIYYLTRTELHMINCDGTNDTVSYTLTDSEKTNGYLYGFRIDRDGELTYGITKDPNEAMINKKRPLCEHTYGAWQTTKAATCEVEGEQSRTCSGCGKTETKAVTALEHTYGDWTITKAATCEVEGEKSQLCTKCGKVGGQKEKIAALGHAYGAWQTTKAATCETEGQQSRNCSRCGKAETKVVVALSHTYGDWKVTKAATCAMEGERSRTCTTCGRAEIDVLPVLEHAYGDWQTTKAATCDTEGEQTRTCSQCDKIETKVVPALAHTYGDWQITKDATCEAEGEQSRTCAKCNRTETETLPTLEHMYDEWKMTEEATCEAEGTQTRTCDNCGKIETKVLPALGHKYGEWEVTREANCEEAGEQVRVCSKCKEMEEQEIAALGHSYEQLSTEAATCDEEGYTVRVCSRCEDEIINEIPATGHKHTKSSTIEPNFVKEGLQTIVCTDCGKTIDQKTLVKKQCKKGQNYTVGNYKYKIVSPKTNGTGTVAFAGVVKDQAKVPIGNKVAIQGASFKIAQVSDSALKNKKKLTSVAIGTNVSSIGKEAFSGAKKLKTITVKSTKLTKVGKNALKNIHKKAKVKVPGSKLKQYKKLFKGKGQKSTVKITK